MTAQEIISDVLRRHRIGRADFFSRNRPAHLVATRREAARRLKPVCRSNGEIARLLKRNQTTICFYLNEKISERKKREYALRHLSPDAKAVLLSVAKAKQVDPSIIVAQWIAERAEYEARRMAA